jgi:leader peptidase (prepilin peptidase)/N-methyltransferase
MSAGPLAGALGPLAAVLGGAVLGVLVSHAVWWLVRVEGGATEDLPAAPRIRPAGIGAAVAFGLWWWEVVCGGQLPATSGAVSAAGALHARFVAHMLLLALIAAASWIDFRLRVIPDAITLPGVVAGMLAAWLVPGQLLPVAVEVPRSFAVPLVEVDVLAAAGGLNTASAPSWLAARPEWWGLVTMTVIVAAWWWVCTPGGYGPRQEGLRRALGAVLAVAMAAAWWGGGRAHGGLMASLVGIAAGGGLVWATRAGASLAMGREAMGLGDVTLMAMVGAWLGWQAAVITFFLGVFLGAGFAAVRRAVDDDTEMPFGPSLGLGAAVTLVAWRPLWAAFGPSFERPLELVAVLGLVVVLTAVALAALQWWRRVRS